MPPPRKRRRPALTARSSASLRCTMVITRALSACRSAGAASAISTAVYAVEATDAGLLSDQTTQARGVHPGRPDAVELAPGRDPVDAVALLEQGALELRVHAHDGGAQPTVDELMHVDADVDDGAEQGEWLRHCAPAGFPRARR